MQTVKEIYVKEKITLCLKPSNEYVFGEIHTIHAGTKGGLRITATGI